VKLTVPPLTNVATYWHYAVLPGMSDEQIQFQMHTDGYFYAAETTMAAWQAASSWPATTPR
jgi:hypothetical protein